MARIRSIHPGLYTDESFMTMSMVARLAWIGLWSECDDQGAFEWKSVVLKARLFPADNLDFSLILSELEGMNCIRRYEYKGRSYGLVRNFTRFQRPKKPNAIHFIPAELRSYVGLNGPDFPTSSEPDDGDGGEVPDQDPKTSEIDRPDPELVPDNFPTSSEPVPNQFRTGGEILSQMEDGGWRMKDEEGNITFTNPERDRHAERGVGPPLAKIPIADLETCVAAWNDLAERRGLSRVQTLTEARKQNLRRRLAECGGLSGWEIALARIDASPFLCGSNDRGWRADFDFCTRQSSFTKLMEGRYDEHSPRNGFGIQAALADLGEQFAQGDGYPRYRGTH